MKGRIFSIEEFSTFDGPGIRTTVFLKGCPLKCSWCHNPEGQSYDKEYAKLSGGVKVYGEDITSEALAEKLLKNVVILNGSGGGVTFSGGEPLFQADFYIDCAKKLSGKLSCALQTTGYATSEVFNKTLLFTDFYLYDLKLFDLKKHEEFCGVKNELIIKNYKTLAGSGKNFVTRIPLIPSVTDTEENLSSLAKFISSCDVRCVELLPYNKFAGAKYANLSREYKPAFDETKKVNINKEIFSDYKITAKVF